MSSNGALTVLLDFFFETFTGAIDLCNVSRLGVDLRHTAAIRLVNDK